MTNLHIQGGNNLQGDVLIDGAKNSIMVLMAAALLTDEEVVLHNVDRKSTRLNSSHVSESRMPSSA